MKKLLIILFGGIGLTGNAQWVELGGVNSLAANSQINSIAADLSGNIYAGGDFKNTIGNYYVAKYDGNSWSELGGPNVSIFNSFISSVITDKVGNVYVAGHFTNSAGNAYVAKYDGNTWSELGGNNSLAANYEINTLTIDKFGNIYAAGDFTNLAGNSYVAKFNGNIWKELGGNNALNPNNRIRTITTDTVGNIYAAGDFSNMYSHFYVAKYDGSIWSELGGLNALNPNNSIRTITSDVHNNIYAGGDFFDANLKFYESIFNGNNWSELGGINLNANGGMYASTTDKFGNIYIAGFFTNGVTVYNGNMYVAKWDGIKWSELGGSNNSTFNADIQTITTDRFGYIYAAGTFTNANNKYYVAKFNPCRTNSILSVSACDSFYWSATNKTYKSSCFDSTYLSSLIGCDSTVTLNLTINHSTSTDTFVTTCNSFTWYGNTYPKDTSVTHHFKGKYGCDSVVTMHLTIKTVLTSDTFAIACNNLTWYGNVYSITQSILKHFITINGCDSIVTLHLTISPGGTSVTIDSICKGASYLFNGNRFNSSGTFTTHLTNLNGCDSVAILQLKVIEKPVLSGISLNTSIVCPGGKAEATDTALNGVWNSSNSNVATIDSKGNIIGVNAGSCNIRYSKTNFCGTTIDSATFNIALGAKSSFITIPDPPMVCLDSSIQFIDNTPGATISIFNLGNSSTDSGFVVNHTYQNTTGYWVYHTVTNALGCISDTSKVYVSVVNPPTVTLIDSVFVLKNSNIMLEPVVTGTGNLKYNWVPDIYLNNNQISSPICTPQNTITYTLFVNNDNGCTTPATLKVVVLENISIPNAFSPNDDAYHQTWEIPMLNDYPNAEVIIFNRGGNQIYRCTGQYKAWDGKYNGKKVPFGTYYYIIKRSFGLPVLSGTVSVIL